MALEPLDDDDGPTIVKPTPGGIRRTSSRPVGQPMAAPASVVAFDFALLANSSFNVVVGAAAQLLNLARRLRGSVSNRNVGLLRDRAVEEVKAFERNIMAAGVQPSQARAAHYALCATLDDIVLNTPWGAYSEWASASLVSTFHADVSGGERFFDLLTHLHKDPGTNRDVLALMYLCLSIGFEGRLRVIENGALELSRIREGLYTTLRQVYGDFERELSPHWRGVEARHRPVRSAIALWTIASAAAVLLIAGYFLFSWLLNGDSDRTFEALATLKPAGPISLAVQKAAPVPHVAPSALATLRAALGAQIAAHQLDVLPDGKTIIIRIHNTGMFASGSDVVQDKFKPIIAEVATVVAAQKGPVLVLGHTDNQPIHTIRFPSNFELSTARAQAVAEQLVPTVDEGRISILGDSDTVPIASNGTADGREQNRRTEVVLSEVQTTAGSDQAGAPTTAPTTAPPATAPTATAPPATAPPPPDPSATPTAGAPKP